MGTGTLRTRLVLDRISRKKDGTIAAANTANRKRMVLGSVLEHDSQPQVARLPAPSGPQGVGKVIQR